MQGGVRELEATSTEGFQAKRESHKLADSRRSVCPNRNDKKAMPRYAELRLPKRKSKENTLQTAWGTGLISQREQTFERLQTSHGKCGTEEEVEQYFRSTADPAFWIQGIKALPDQSFDPDNLR